MSTYSSLPSGGGTEGPPGPPGPPGPVNDILIGYAFQVNGRVATTKEIHTSFNAITFGDGDFEITEFPKEALDRLNIGDVLAIAEKEGFVFVRVNSFTITNDERSDIQSSVLETQSYETGESFVPPNISNNKLIGVLEFEPREENNLILDELNFGDWNALGGEWNHGDVDNSVTFEFSFNSQSERDLSFDTFLVPYRSALRPSDNTSNVAIVVETTKVGTRGISVVLSRAITVEASSGEDSNLELSTLTQTTSEIKSIRGGDGITITKDSNDEATIKNSVLRTEDLEDVTENDRKNGDFLEWSSSSNTFKLVSSNYNIFSQAGGTNVQRSIELPLVSKILITRLPRNSDDYFYLLPSSAPLGFVLKIIYSDTRSNASLVHIRQAVSDNQNIRFFYKELTNMGDSTISSGISQINFTPINRDLGSTTGDNLEVAGTFVKISGTSWAFTSSI